MKWRGQGILTVMVLAGAAALGWQWHTATVMVEALRVRELPIGAYTRVVVDYYASHGQFPQPQAVTLPRPSGDLIRAAALRDHGEIDFTLTAWRVFQGHARVLMAPKLVPGGQPHSVTLSYVCLKTDPSQAAALVCSRNGIYTRDELAQANAEFERSLAAARAAVKERARIAGQVSDVRTSCDRYVAISHDIGQCIANADAPLAQQFSQFVTREFANRPRLRSDVIASAPELLDAYNRECDVTWRQFVGMVPDRPQIRGCFRN